MRRSVLHDYTVDARARDDAWFSKNPRATWRVRPMLPVECPILAELAERQGGVCYAIVIDHQRAGDRRAVAGRGVYPTTVLATMPKARRKRWLQEEALRWLAHFKRSASTPMPAEDTMIMMDLKG
ncbi:MAG: hypothetical protein AAF968_24350 [Pseudomonadota bacterium]